MKTRIALAAVNLLMATLAAWGAWRAILAAGLDGVPSSLAEPSVKTVEAVAFAPSESIPLFVEPLAGLVADKKEPAPMPEIRLTGVISFQDAPRLSRAFIIPPGAKEGDEATFREGDDISSGLRLKAITPSQALFVFDGREHAVPLAADKTAIGLITPAGRGAGAR